MRGWWRDGLCAVVLGLASAAMYWEAALLRGAFFVQDVMVQNYPFRDSLARALRAGTLPLWDPAINCGFPLLAEGQAGSLYPPNLVAALALPTWAGLTAAVLAHVWLAGLAMYGLVRVLGGSRPAALTAGLTYSLSGYLTVRAMSPNYLAVAAWVPVLFLLVELAWQRRRWAWLLPLPAVVALQFLAGHPQAAAYGLLVFLVYALWRARTIGVAWWKMAAVPGLVGLGGALAAAQLVPTAELVSLSKRGTGLSLDRFLQMSLPPERLITLILPNYFGNSGTGSYWGQEAGFFIQLCPYLGVLGLFLCLIAVLERRDAGTGAFAWIAVAGLGLSLGRYTGFFELLYDIPGLASFRIPSRFLLWWALGGSVLSGLGLDCLIQGREVSFRRRAAIAGLASVGGVMVWYNGPALGALPGPGPGATYGQDLLADTWRAALALGAAVLLAELGWRWRGLALVAPVAVFADLFSFGHGFNAVIPTSTYTDIPASARAIHRDLDRAPMGPGVVSALGRARCVSVVSEANSPWNWHGGWMVDMASYRAYPATLRMYTATQYGLANTLPGWSPLHLRSHWELTGAYPSLLPAVNARYVVSHRPLSWPDLEMIHRGQVRVYSWRRALPRAYVVSEAVSMPDPQQRLAYLGSARFRPRRQVVLSQAHSTAGSRAEGREEAGLVAAAISVYEPQRVVVDLPGVGGYLVLSDTHYPGWRAEVDGRRRQILEANHAFRGLAVEPVDRQVVFTYAPASFRLGAWVSALALLFYAGVVWRARGRVVTLAPSPSPSMPPWPAALPQVLLIVILHGIAVHADRWAAVLERCQRVASF